MHDTLPMQVHHALRLRRRGTEAVVQQHQGARAHVKQI
jgi:hypothetical protein